MADREKKGLVARWLEGKERSEDYARSTLPTSRWSLFWDIFKGRFGRLVLVNLLMLVTPSFRSRRSSYGVCSSWKRSRSSGRTVRVSA